MRKIELTRGLAKYDVREPFPVGDLELYVGLPMISGEFRLVGFMNKTKIGEFTLARDHNIIYIPRKSLSAGVFSCYVSHYVNGTEVHRYNVENLIITDLNDNLSAMPEIELINSKLTELTDKAEKLEKQLTELMASFDKRAEQIDELLKATADTRADLLKIFKWAYKVESEVPFLDGGTETEFYEKFGIKGDNDNEQ